MWGIGQIKKRKNGCGTIAMFSASILGRYISYSDYLDISRDDK